MRVKQALLEVITSAMRITSVAISCTNFGVVIHILLWWFLQTFAALFTNFCRDLRKLLPRCSQNFAVTSIIFCRVRCSQTFAVTFINFCRVIHKLLPWLLQTFAALFTNFCRESFCCDASLTLFHMGGGGGGRFCPPSDCFLYNFR